MMAPLAFFKRFERKHIMITIAIALLVLNFGRMAISFYVGQRQEVESQMGLLEQYLKTAAKLPELKRRVGRLDKRSKGLEPYLYRGSSVEDISSAMQIDLQKKVSDAGLEPESIRPVRQSGQGRSSEGEELVIKLRVSGSQKKFIDFLAGLYRSGKLFQIQSFTLKPYKKKDLKIFLDVKGFYHLSRKD